MIRNSIDFQGHQDQSIRIHKNLGPYCQMLLFSATYDQVVVAFNSCTLYLDGKPSENPTVQAVMDFAENIVSNPVTIKLRREEESLDNIKQVGNFSFLFSLVLKKNLTAPL